MLALPVSGLTWRKLRTWRRSGPEKTGQAEVWAGRQSRSMGTLDEAGGTPCPFLGVKQTFSLRAQGSANDP